MDRVARDVILRSLRNALPTNVQGLTAEIKSIVEQGHEPTLPTFLRESGVALSDIYAGGRAFSDVLERAGLPVLPAGPHESQLRRAIGRLLHIDDLERIATYKRLLIGESSAVLALSEREIRLWRMLVAQIMQGAMRRGDSLADATAHLWAHPQVRTEITQLLDVLGEDVEHEHPALASDSSCPLLIHARYSRVEIQAALGEGTGALVPLWQEGVKWLPDQAVDALVVTINKSDSGFSPSTAYRDFALSRTLFHWESQSRTSADSIVGMRYQEHVQRGSRVLLFARMNRDDRDFWFLGPCQYVTHQGSQPIQITWRLEYAIPPDLYPDMSAVA
jgi:hypothetical protein